MIRTGFVLWDKYLGDALYAAMVFEILRLLWRPRPVAVWAMVVMTVIELFQLTGIAAQMMVSDNLAVRIVARLLGTQFSLFDLLAYGVGIACIYLADSRRRRG